MTIDTRGMTLELNEDTLGYALTAHGRRWETAQGFEPYFMVGEKK